MPYLLRQEWFFGSPPWLQVASESLGITPHTGRWSIRQPSLSVACSAYFQNPCSLNLKLFLWAIGHEFSVWRRGRSVCQSSFEGSWPSSAHESRPWREGVTSFSCSRTSPGLPLARVREYSVWRAPCHLPVRNSSPTFLPSLPR